MNSYCRIVLVLIVWLTDGGLPPALADDEPASSATLVTVEAVLDREFISVGDVRWANNEHPFSDFHIRENKEPQIRLLSLDGTFSVSKGEGKLSAYAPDGRAALLHTKSGWVLRETTSGKDTLVDVPTGETRDFYQGYTPTWSHDSRLVAIVEPFTPSSPTTDVVTVNRDGVSIIDLDRRSSLLSEWVTRITIVDRENPNVPRRIFFDDLARQVGWGKDCSLFVTQVDVADEVPSTTIYRLALESNVPRAVYRTQGRIQHMRPAVQPGGQLIAVALDADNRKWADFVSLVLIDVETGEEVRRLTHNIAITGDDYYWSADGTEIYARVRHGGLDEIWTIPLDGKPRALVRGPRRHFDLTLSPDGKKLSYQTEDGYGRKDIRVLNLETGEEKVVLILDDPSTEFRLGEWRQIRWRSTDGVHPYGFLFLPQDFDPNSRYPMLVNIHGGGPGSRLSLDAPFTIATANGPLEWHAWATMGYVVFVPDYRSTGNYGPKVIAARYKEGEMSVVDDLEDIISGVHNVIGQGFIDPERVAILGHSAGGARAYLALTRHSEMFAAAILNEGIAPDPVSLVIGLASGKHVGDFPVGLFRSVLGADLSDAPERYKANYMFDSYRNRTPTLIMMGNEEKGGVDHMPYEFLYSILKRNGVPTRFLSFVKEGHNYKNPAAARLAFEEARIWLKTHMGGTEDGSVN